MKPTIFWILLGGDGLSRDWGNDPSPSISRHFGHPSACCWARLVRGTVSSENSSENGGKIGWNPSFLMFSDGFLMCSLHSLLCHYVFGLIMENMEKKMMGIKFHYETVSWFMFIEKVAKKINALRQSETCVEYWLEKVEFWFLMGVAAVALPAFYAYGQR